MSKPFSLLEKNEKTFKYVKRYCEALKNGTSYFSVDMAIHKNEICEHLARCGKCETDMKETTDWIMKNSEPMRAWLNSLKVISWSIYADNKRHGIEEITWEEFCQEVDIWENTKASVYDTINIKLQEKEIIHACSE